MIVPSTKKAGGPGCTIDVPIAHANAAYVRSHFDTVVCSINDDGKRNCRDPAYVKCAEDLLLGLED